MKKTKLFLIVLVVSLCLGSVQLFAGGSTEKATQKDTALTVAFSQYANPNNWRVTQTNDMEKTMTDAGFNYIYTDAEDDTGKQVSDMEDLIVQKPDYIILAPRESEGFEDVLEKAKAEGIKVILVDRSCKGEYATYIAADFIWEGETVAKHMIEEFGSDAEVNIVELIGTPGSSVAIERQEGFLNIVKTLPNYKILASQVGDFSRVTSQEAMENLIQAFGDKIDAVYAHNDDNAIGAMQAIRAAGLTPGKDIKIYSIDGQKEALLAIIAGELSCTVLCSPLFGETVLDVINTLESGGTVDPYIQNPGKLFTIENAADNLDLAF